MRDSWAESGRSPVKGRISLPKGRSGLCPKILGGVSRLSNLMSYSSVSVCLEAWPPDRLTMELTMDLLAQILMSASEYLKTKCINSPRGQNGDSGQPSRREVVELSKIPGHKGVSEPPSLALFWACCPILAPECNTL